MCMYYPIFVGRTLLVKIVKSNLAAEEEIEEFLDEYGNIKHENINYFYIFVLCNEYGYKIVNKKDLYNKYKFVFTNRHSLRQPNRAEKRTVQEEIDRICKQTKK